ncbi:MAG: ATP-binding protein [Candidatus Nealsonbacteria bacterium]|nr:ATP-binding protein [Candidatus Nealsonbacteria bacterium]
MKKEDGRLIFKIKDQGVGIPFSDHRYIFQKFFRSSNALKEKTKGSGLGLYIAKLIITKSDGKIWFESEEGNGTAFYFAIPVK